MAAFTEAGGSYGQEAERQLALVAEAERDINAYCLEPIGQASITVPVSREELGIPDQE